MNLTHRQDKIKERMNTVTWREFVRDKMSRKSLNYGRVSGLVSRFPQTERIMPIVPLKERNEIVDTLSDKYYLDYQSDQSFFDQYQQLFRTTPLPNVIHYTPNDGSEYSDCVLGSKNAYLSATVIRACENILYSIDVRYDSRNVLNSLIVYPFCENIYYGVNIAQSYNIFFSKHIVNSNNIWFSMNLTGCSECLLCSDLQNVSYAIKNKIYSKEEYEQLKQELLKNKDKFEDILAQMHKPGNNVNSSDVTGTSIKNSMGIDTGHFVYGLNHAKNVALVGSDEGDEYYINTFLAGR